MILLDTNFLINSLVSGTPEARNTRDWLAAGERVVLSTIVWAEFLCGPLTSEQMRLAADAFPLPEPLLPEDAVRGAELFNAAGRRLGSLADRLIAATCLRLGAGLATRDIDDFRHFVPMGLEILPES